MMTLRAISFWNKNVLAWVHLMGWMLLASIYFLAFNVFFVLEISLLRTVLILGPMAVLFYVNIYLVDRYWERKRYSRYLMLVLFFLLLFIFIRLQINQFLPKIDRIRLLENQDSTWVFGAVITNFITLIFSSLYQLVFNRYKNEQRNLAIITRQNEAQLKFLRAQINPHFLFNTLNNIYSLALVRSDKTADMVLKLSSLLRYVIYESKAELVPLEGEVRQIQRFIDLFQMRSEEPLNIGFETRITGNGERVEPMILIPIVENCFKHCDFDTNEEAFIRVDLRADGRRLHFRTINSKDDRNQQKDQIGGVGLENIRKRLELKYPGKFHLEVGNEPNRFEVNLYLDL